MYGLGRKWCVFVGGRDRCGFGLGVCGWVYACAGLFGIGPFVWVWGRNGISVWGGCGAKSIHRKSCDRMKMTTV